MTNSLCYCLTAPRSFCRLVAPAPVQQKRRETAFGQQLPSGDPAHSCCQRSRVPAEGAGGDAEEQQLSSWSILATPALHFSRQDFIPTPRGFCTSRLHSSCTSSSRAVGVGAPFPQRYDTSSHSRGCPHAFPVPSWCLGNDK